MSNDNQTKRWQELAVHIANQEIDLHRLKLKSDNQIEYNYTEIREDVFSNLLDFMCEIEKKYPVN